MRVSLFVANFPAHPAVIGAVAKAADALAVAGATVAAEALSGRLLVDVVADTEGPHWGGVEAVLDGMCELAARSGGVWEEVEAIA